MEKDKNLKENAKGANINANEKQKNSGSVASQNNNNNEEVMTDEEMENKKKLHGAQTERD